MAMLRLFLAFACLAGAAPTPNQQRTDELRNVFEWERRIKQIGRLHHSLLERYFLLAPPGLPPAGFLKKPLDPCNIPPNILCPLPVGA